MADFGPFWDQFKKLEKNLRSVSRLQSQRADWMEDYNKLQSVMDPVADLTVEIRVSSGISTLVISAEGDKTLFPAVLECVAQAPKIDGWEVKAFRQRGALDDATEIFDTDVNADDVRIRLEAADGKVNIWVLLREELNLTEKQAGMTAFILLDHLFGEYDVETKIGAISPEIWPKGKEWPGSALTFPEAIGVFDSHFNTLQ